MSNRAPEYDSGVLGERNSFPIPFRRRSEEKNWRDGVDWNVVERFAISVELNGIEPSAS